MPRLRKYEKGRQAHVKTDRPTERSCFRAQAEADLRPGCRQRQSIVPVTCARPAMPPWISKDGPLDFMGCLQWVGWAGLAESTAPALYSYQGAAEYVKPDLDEWSS